MCPKQNTMCWKTMFSKHLVLKICTMCLKHHVSKTPCVEKPCFQNTLCSKYVPCVQNTMFWITMFSKHLLFKICTMCSKHHALNNQVFKTPCDPCVQIMMCSIHHGFQTPCVQHKRAELGVRSCSPFVWRVPAFPRAFSKLFFRVPRFAIPRSYVPNFVTRSSFACLKKNSRAHTTFFSVPDK